ncbi:MAG: HAMP domain-containing histidine kinase [Thermoflexales bacterium]|nr:HAMP domain-containing histidine kinase [Thermoflexales bacterium]
MSIRRRLVVVYTSIIAMTLIVTGALVYTAVSFLMLQQVDDLLRTTFDTITDLTRARLLQNGKITAELPGDVFRSVVIQAYDDSGEMLDSSTRSINASLDAMALRDSLQMAPDKRMTRYTTVWMDGVPLRVLTAPVAFTGQSSGREVTINFQVATPIQDIEVAKRFLLGTLLGVGLLSLLLVVAAGGAVAGRAIRPITRITQTAVDITRTNNLDQRVSAQTDDEVGELSRAFNAMVERLSQSIKAQQRLVADVSHEMRTPLTVIRGNVDLLRRTSTDTESLDAIAGESERMTRMVSNLLLLSQADAGALEMKTSVVDMRELASEVARAGQFIGEGKKGVAVDVVGDGPFDVEGERDRLKQVLLNLVDNAIKYSPDGCAVGMTIATEAARSESPAREDAFIGERVVRVTVRDSGPGIPAEDLPHIFERFYRVDKSRSRARGGSGLGLSIAQTIVDAHGGRIQARSELGKGTEIDVLLPAYQPRLV